VFLDQPVHLVPVLIALRGELVGEETQRRCRGRRRHVLRALVEVEPEARRRPLVQEQLLKLGALHLRRHGNRRRLCLALPLPPDAAICAPTSTNQSGQHQPTRPHHPKTEQNEILS
jgi:hypothetical protein